MCNYRERTYFGIFTILIQNFKDRFSHTTVPTLKMIIFTLKKNYIVRKFS